MIKFGTDGWRGVIAEDFTFQNLRNVALATAKFILKTSKDKPSAVVGYDTRFLSKQFAEETARILAWKGVKVHITDSFATTPQVSFQTKQKKVSLGIMITASHNPAIYNGYKIKANFGGPGSPEQIAALEKELKTVLKKPPQIRANSLESYAKLGRIKRFNPKTSYFNAIRKKIDIEAIKKANFKIVYDPMFGAGIGTLDSFFSNVELLHAEVNPSFGNLDRPEPIAENLKELSEKVKAGKFDIGIASDGDADRLGVISPDGSFVDSHKVFMILLKYLSEYRKKKGAVVKTVSLTSMVDKYCEKRGIKLYETPVGFKHTAKIMSQEKVIVGGEESGGLGVSLHIPERDGLFNALLLMEAMAVQKKSLLQLTKDLDEEFGPHRFVRKDVRVEPKLKDKIMKACAKLPKKIGGREVKSVNDKDGYKFIFDDAWLLIRPSGTEPLLRFYAEAPTFRMANELIDAGMKLK